MLTVAEAERIAKKLGAEISNRSKHRIAVVRIEGTYIGRFGIRRGTKGSHGYIPNQIRIARHQALGLANCSVSKAAYVRILRERGLLPPRPAM
ncbi:MAG: hypothetical protein OXN89_12165 [Bryobacterales bacterium]|nr:hypothetical protein [Bryobacterales bacterium]